MVPKFLSRSAWEHGGALTGVYGISFIFLVSYLDAAAIFLVSYYVSEVVVPDSPQIIFGFTFLGNYFRIFLSASSAALV